MLPRAAPSSAAGGGGSEGLPRSFSAAAVLPPGRAAPPLPASLLSSGFVLGLALGLGAPGGGVAARDTPACVPCTNTVSMYVKQALQQPFWEDQAHWTLWILDLGYYLAQRRGQCPHHW